MGGGHTLGGVPHLGAGLGGALTPGSLGCSLGIASSMAAAAAGGSLAASMATLDGLTGVGGLGSSLSSMAGGGLGMTIGVSSSGMSHGVVNSLALVSSAGGLTSVTGGHLNGEIFATISNNNVKIMILTF